MSYLRPTAVCRDPAAAENSISSSPTANGCARRAECRTSITADPLQAVSMETALGLPEQAEKPSPSPEVTTFLEPTPVTSPFPPLSIADKTPVSAVIATGQPRPAPFCVECSYLHMDDLAKFCALCGHKRVHLFY
nr:unnamed protein product [Leishmania braziliensis]CAJ2479380.1 unnamed protein product [Leishmania braziliensis]